MNTTNAAKNSLEQIVTSITDRNPQIVSTSEQQVGFLPEPVFVEDSAYTRDRSAYAKSIQLLEGIKT